jgi:rhodanese-related sulfurtransferase
MRIRRAATPLSRLGRGRAWLVVAVALVWTTTAGADHGWAPVLTIDVDSAKSLLDRGERVEPLDLRSPTEFQTGRLPRARSLPLGDLPDRVDEVPRSGVVVLYCGCPRDQLVRAYQFLRGRRHTNVFVLDGDIDAWRGRGYALER